MALLPVIFVYLHPTERHDCPKLIVVKTNTDYVRISFSGFILGLVYIAFSRQADPRQDSRHETGSRKDTDTDGCQHNSVFDCRIFSSVGEKSPSGLRLDGLGDLHFNFFLVVSYRRLNG